MLHRPTRQRSVRKIRVIGTQQIRRIVRERVKALWYATFVGGMIGGKCGVADTMKQTVSEVANIANTDFSLACGVVRKPQRIAMAQREELFCVDGCSLGHIHIDGETRNVSRGVTVRKWL